MECVIYLFFSPSGRFFISALLPRLSGCRNRSGYRLPGSLYQWATIYFRGCPWCQQSSPGPWAETATSELRSPSPGIHYLHFLVCQAICTVLHNDPAAPQKDAEFWHVFNEPRHLIIYLSVLHHLLLVSSPNAILNIWYSFRNVLLSLFFCTTFVQEDVNGGPGCPQH